VSANQNNPRGPGFDVVSWLHVVVLLAAGGFSLWVALLLLEASEDPDAARRGARTFFGFPLVIVAVLTALLALAALVGLMKRRAAHKRIHERELRVAAYRERFRTQPTEVLKAEANVGGLVEEAAEALRDVLREREANGGQAPPA
jgi:hypothetical protein